MSRKVPDRRIARTRASLGFALFTLMQKQSWATITIQQICDTANVARASFYAHFDTKIALLDALITEQFSRLGTQAARAPGDYAYVAFLTWFVDHITSSKPLFSRIALEPEAQPVLIHFKKALTKQLDSALRQDGLVATETEFAFIMGGTFDALIHWSRHWRMKQVPQLRTDILALAAKVLAK